MSEPIKKDNKPRPSSVSVAPAFPLLRLLPTDPSQLSKNITQQKRDEIAFGSQYRKELEAKGKAFAGIPCNKTLHITLAFDGTNNNDKADSASVPSSCSNIARIFHASLGDVTDIQAAGFYRYYSPGVGTVFPDVREYTPRGNGLIGAAGGENRINWGLTRLIDVLKKVLTPEAPLLLPATQELIDGMATCWYGNVLTAGLLESGEKKREAAMRPYIDDLENLLNKRRDAEEKPHILAMRLYVYGFSRGAAQARRLQIGCRRLQKK